MRQQEPPGRERRLNERGLMARDLDALARVATFDRFSATGQRDWGMLVGGHNLTLRGCEFGRADARAFVGRRGLTIADLDWGDERSPRRGADGRRLLWVWVYPAKDPRVTHKKILVPVVRRHGDEVGEGADPLCPYDALRAVWRDVSRHAPRARWADTPLFQNALGGAVCTSDVGAAVRRAAAAIGIDATTVGAKSLRIGSATDLLFYMRDAARVERFLEARGRWQTDIGFIYARRTLEEAVEVSLALGSSRATSLEAVAGDWDRRR